MTPTHQPESPRAFKHIGGDLIYRGRWLSPERAQDYDALFRKEAQLARKADDEAGEGWALGLLSELTAARFDQAQWARCASIRKAA